MLTTFSYSSLNCFRQCPRQFKFRYVDKIKVPRVVTPDTYLGTTMHRVLRKLYRLGADDILMPEDDAVAEYHREWEKLDLTTLQVTSDYYTVDDYIRIGEKMLVRHYDKHRPFNQGTMLGTELYLSFELPNSPFKIRGYIDKLWRRDDDVVEICDYKTGMTVARPQDDAFRWQMGIYELAVRATWPQYETIELTQHFLRPDELVRCRLSPDQLELLTEELRNIIIETHQAERLGNFPAQEGGYCRFCDYQEYCPAKRHEKMLVEDTTDETEDDVSESVRLEQLADRYLSVYDQSNAAKAELDALKEELRQIVRNGGPTKLVGSTGAVTVKLGTVEKFITRTRDAVGFAELSAVARKLGLEEFFELNGRALMKDLYRKERLAAEQLEKLKPFVREDEESRVTAKPFKKAGPDDK